MKVVMGRWDEAPTAVAPCHPLPRSLASHLDTIDPLVSQSPVSRPWV